MAKIIEDKANTFKITCKNCYSKLQCDKSDVFDNDVAGTYRILCPACEKGFTAYTDEIPKRVLEMLR